MEIRPVAIFIAACLAGLALLYLVAPDRPDLLAACAAGTLFGASVGLAGLEIVRRAAMGKGPAVALQAFLAVMAGKVLVFPAFLLIIAFSTQLNLAALAAGLAGATVMAEILVVHRLRRMEAGPGGAGSAGLSEDPPPSGREQPQPDTPDKH